MYRTKCLISGANIFPSQFISRHKHMVWWLAKAFLGLCLKNFTNAFLARGYLPGSWWWLLWSQAGLMINLFGTLATHTGENIHHGISVKRAQMSVTWPMLIPRFLKFSIVGRKRGTPRVETRPPVSSIERALSTKPCYLNPWKLVLEKELRQGGLITARRGPGPAGLSHHYRCALKSPLFCLGHVQCQATQTWYLEG